MAGYLTLDYGSHDFGNVLLDIEGTEFSFTLTNDTGGTVNISSVSCDDPFTVVSGGGSFALADGAHSHIVVNVRPLSLGSITGHLSIAHDHVPTGSPVTSDLLANGTAPFKEYQLPTIYNSASGDIKCFLYVDYTIPDLTIPSSVRVMSIGETREAVDLDPGTIDIEFLTVELNEDYSTYSEGFWYKLIEGYPTKDVQFMFILSEDGTDSFFFRGSLFRENVRWEERYVSGTTRIRVLSIQLVSMIHYLKQVSIETLYDELTVRNPSTWLTQGELDGFFGGTPAKCVNINDLVRAMMKCAMGVLPADTYTAARRDDIIVYDHAGDYVSPFFYGYIVVQTDMGTGYASDGFLSMEEIGNPPSDEFTWNKRYENCADILSAVSRSLGVIPRYYYGDSNAIYQGDSNDKHSIEFVTRGNAFTNKITLGTPVSSTMTSDTRLKVLNISAEEIGTLDTALGITKKKWAIGGIYGDEDFPQNTNVDVTITQEFGVTGYNGSALKYYQTQGLLTLYDDSGNHFMQTQKIQYWDYQNEEWVTAENVGGAYLNVFLEFSVKYLSKRFTTGRKQFEREYASMRGNNLSTNSQQNVKVCARTDISDGVETNTYYATEVRKNIMGNSARITWIQE